MSPLIIFFVAHIASTLFKLKIPDAYWISGLKVMGLSLCFGLASTLLNLLFVLTTIRFSLRTLMSFMLGFSFSAALIALGLPWNILGVLLASGQVAMIGFTLRQMRQEPTENQRRLISIQ